MAPRDTVVRIYSAQDGELDLELAGHTELVQSAEFDRSGDRVLTASSDNSAVVWDSHTGKRLVDVSDYYRGKCVARWVPGDRLFVTFSNDRAMKLLDAASGNVVCSLDGHALKITDADFSPDGARSVTAGENARLWNVSGATSPLRRAPRDSRVMRTQIAPNGRFVAFPLADGTTRILDVARMRFGRSSRAPRRREPGGVLARWPPRRHLRFRWDHAGPRLRDRRVPRANTK